MPEQNLYHLLLRIIANIQNELLLFSVGVIILLVLLPELRIWIFIIFLVASLFYALIKYLPLFNKEKSVIKQFKKYLQKPEKWEKKLHRTHEYWIYKEHPLFQIETGENIVEDFREKWMKKYPDMDHNRSFRVYLKYMNTIIDDYIFVALDGFRYIVPLPEREEGNYFYRADSLQFLLANIVGSFYLYKTLEEFSLNHNIETRN